MSAIEWNTTVSESRELLENVKGADLMSDADKDELAVLLSLENYDPPQ